jgi:hypothetical protein
MPKSELFNFMQQMKDELAAEYERIRIRATDDPGTAGDEGEENWAALFRSWLPANYHVVTKGRIINAEGKTGPQVDVLVLHPAYPRHLLNKKHYLAGGVLAAFECKLTLRAEHLSEAFGNGQLVKGLCAKREGTPYGELTQPIVYGLLAHSHHWRSSGMRAAMDLHDRIHDRQFDGPQAIREMLDLVCVADTATYCLHKHIYIGPNRDLTNLGDGASDFPNGEGVSTGYFCSWDDEQRPMLGTVLGALVCELLTKLAFEDPSIRWMAKEFAQAGIHGGGLGQATTWYPEVFSAETLRKLRESGCSSDQWNEWYSSF